MKLLEGNVVKFDHTTHAQLHVIIKITCCLLHRQSSSREIASLRTRNVELEGDVERLRRSLTSEKFERYHPRLPRLVSNFDTQWNIVTLGYNCQQIHQILNTADQQIFVSDLFSQCLWIKTIPKIHLFPIHFLDILRPIQWIYFVKICCHKIWPRKGICLQYMTANTLHISIIANTLNITIITMVIQKFIKNISFWRNENIQTNTFNCL